MRTPGEKILDIVPRWTTLSRWSAAIGATGSPSNAICPYGLSSTMSTPCFSQIAPTSARRPGGRRAPEGFANEGIV